MARHRRRKHTARQERPDEAGQPPDQGPGERLQKVLAAAGVGSRRDCEELIREGRVEVDRQVITEQGTRVDPLRQEIRVDGEPLRRPQRLYYAVNKPMGVVTTSDDPSGRPRVIDLVPTDERVFAVGRLDRASEGLILVTNDGEFANRLTHPRYGVEKTYLVRVAGSPSPAELNRLTKGVYLSDGFCRVQSITVKRKHGQSTDLVMVLNEGRNRELRRILARVGHKVLRLKRIAVGSVKLADLPTGAWRRLMPFEVESLLALAKEKRRASKSKKKPVRKPGAIKPVHGEREESPYIQQQALMAEPLSLEDLLRDDMDEGNLAESGGDAASADGNALGGVSDSPLDAGDDLGFSDDTPRGKPGGVIEYEDGPAAGGRAKRFIRGQRSVRPAGKQGKFKRGNKPKAEQLEPLPRESFGKKPGGKRVFGRLNKGGGPAGKTAGNFAFRKRKEVKDHGRPPKRGAKRFAKPDGQKPTGRRGGKRKGRR